MSVKRAFEIISVTLHLHYLFWIAISLFKCKISFPISASSLNCNTFKDTVANPKAITFACSDQ